LLIKVEFVFLVEHSESDYENKNDQC